MSSWADWAHAVMLETLLECEARGMNPEQKARAIDAAYPFGPRSHYPYKAWLRVRKAFFARHGLPRNGDRRSQTERLDDLVACMSPERPADGVTGPA